MPQNQIVLIKSSHIFVGDAQLIDCRGPDQYNSKEHNGLGHIPNAVNIPYIDFIDSNGNLKSKDELRNLVSQLKLDPSKETITYCHGGVTACIANSALEEIGFSKVRLYDGSWAEYSSQEKTKEIK